MVSSKFFIVLSGSAIVAGLIGPAQAVAPRNGEQGSLEPSMIESDATGPKRFVAPCEIEEQTSNNPDYATVDHIPNSTACRRRCQSESRCQWYTYNWETKRCYLKEKKADIVKSMVRGDVTGPKICSTCEYEGKTSRATDYRNVSPVQDSKVCKQLCTDDTRCAWWSYNKKAQSCHLKEKLQELISAPLAGEVSGPPVCELEEIADQTATGEDYKTLTGIDSIYTCRAMCRREKDCFFFTYNMMHQKCYFKFQRGMINRGAAGDLTAPANPRQCTLDGMTSSHHDYEVTENIVPDPDSCKARCKADDKCAWWTYNKAEKKCFLKAGVGLTRPSVGADVTGPKVCERCEIPNRTGNAKDISTLSGISSPYTCQQRCKANDRCNWYTHNRPAGKCYLKQESGMVIRSKVAGDVTGPKVC